MICVLVFVTPVRVWSQNLMWIAAFNFAAPAMVFTQVRLSLRQLREKPGVGLLSASKTCQVAEA